MTYTEGTDYEVYCSGDDYRWYWNGLGEKSGFKAPKGYDRRTVAREMALTTFRGLDRRGISPDLFIGFGIGFGVGFALALALVAFAPSTLSGLLHVQVEAALSSANQS